MKEPIPIAEWTEEDKAYAMLGALVMHTYFLRLLHEMQNRSSLISVRSGVLEPVGEGDKEVCAASFSAVLRLLGGAIVTLSGPLLKLFEKESITDVLAEVTDVITQLKNNDPQALAQESWEHVREKHPEMPSYADLITMCQMADKHPGKNNLN